MLFLALSTGILPAHAVEPRNIILLIGDGMGPEAVGLAVYYNRFMNGPDRPLHMERMMAAGNTGYCLTYQYGTVVTDSASAATALASGVKTRDAMIGKDHDGRPMRTILDVAGQLGKSTGVISNTRITHATPAGFYATILHRDMESQIASQLVDRGDVTVALSAGAQFFIPKGTKVEEHADLRGTPKAAGWGLSRREDDRDLVAEAKAKGYAVVASAAELAAVDAGRTEKLLGLVGAAAFPSAIDRQPHHQSGVPTLSEMTQKALDLLAKNPRGFFLMVEGGQVDWVEHANDVASVLHEMLELDEALKVVLAFAEANPHTLVVMTADHDTGGLAIAYNSHNPPAPVTLASGETWKSKYNFNDRTIFEKMARQKKSFFKMIQDAKSQPADLRKQVEDNSAFTLSEEQAAAVLAKHPRLGYPAPGEYTEFYVYGSMNPVALMGRLLGKEMGTAWAVGTHTHTPVMVFAKGPWAEKYRGLLDNTDVPRIMAQAWGASLPSPK
jgi:alkaline phosphatase